MSGNPLVVSLGMGVDSVGLLVGLRARQIVPDVIMHSRVGNEWPETDAYRPVMDRWLSEVGFPAITDVQYRVQRPKNGPYATLEENCLVNATLPSLAFGGRKACSAKWKGQPIDKAVRARFAPHIATGGLVDRMIGYDAGPKDRKRCGTEESSGPWRWLYPLREWGWDRERCAQEIQLAGLPVPHKSACWFCPATTEVELLELAANHPHLARRAVAMEDGAQPNLIQISGLWDATEREQLINSIATTYETEVREREISHWESAGSGCALTPSQIREQARKRACADAATLRLWLTQQTDERVLEKAATLGLHLA